jgi:hypothetical protein
MVLYLSFVIGFGVGCIVSGLVVVYIAKKSMAAASRASFGGDWPQLQACMSGCLQDGLAFGSDEFNACVSRCMKRRAGHSDGAAQPAKVS